MFGHGKKHTISGIERKDICGAADVKQQKMLTGAADITGGTSLLDKQGGDIKLQLRF